MIKPHEERCKEPVWDNGLCSHRIPMSFTHSYLLNNRQAILGTIRDAFVSEWGAKWGLGILNQHVIEGESASVVMDALAHRQNDLANMSEQLDVLSAAAKAARDGQAAKPAAVKPPSQPTASSEALPATDLAAAESEHSKAQAALVQLGRATGCLVWIAANDKGRMHQGHPLGEHCLKSLPNFGLNKEATDRISMIDIIWIRQSAPVYAFEVEMTTSVYSGLLRMSDLLALVPALNVKLFIVAPKARQDKVMGELARPTFRKIGLSDYCRFVATEDLYKIIGQVQGLEGHIQPSVLEAVAVELQSEADGTGT